VSFRVRGQSYCERLANGDEQLSQRHHDQRRLVDLLIEEMFFDSD
jgi:hypothetical protein